VHGGYFQRVDERGARALRKASLSRTFRSVYALFDRVIAVSRHVADDLSSRPGVKVPSSKIAVIPNGADAGPVARTAWSTSRAALGIPADGPIVTTVANFVPMKGHRYLVSAMPDVLAARPDATFLFVGLGSEQRSVRNLVGAAGLDSRVRFLGARRDAVEIMANSSVVVLPSVAAEGIPITILEALGAGRPVVATRIGGIPEVIDDGVTGLLVRPRDPQALADAINRLLADPSAAAAMADRGRALVQAQFTARRMAQPTEELYGETLRLKRRRVPETGIGR
jgi:glycosyltransferase involved in cell wall biosynthesis